MTSTQVAMWARRLRIAIKGRDDAIRAMREEGASLREIATAAGLTGPGVRKILERQALRPDDAG